MDGIFYRFGITSEKVINFSFPYLVELKIIYIPKIETENYFSALLLDCGNIDFPYNIYLSDFKKCCLIHDFLYYKLPENIFKNTSFTLTVEYINEIKWGYIYYEKSI